MAYILNGKPISSSQFKRQFNSSMVAFIHRSAKEAFNAGEKKAIFKTDLGSLVVKP